jgi:hypothetical protein
MVETNKKSSNKRPTEEQLRRWAIIDDLFVEDKLEDKTTSKPDNNKYPTVMVSSSDICYEMINKQIADVPRKWKLSESDMSRICQRIDDSIFSEDPNKCCIWKGYITNATNSDKGTYVNFYYNRKKMALHRLLYANFVAPLKSNEYIKFKCKNKGTCCNVNHYEKYTYSSSAKKISKRNIEKDPYAIEISFGESNISLI